MQLVDTHCHLDVPDFDPDREQVIRAAAAVGVTRILVPAIHAEGWSGLLGLCERFLGLYPALGLHPLYIQQHTDAHLEVLERLVDDIRPVAVGEIGLDFFVRDLDPKRQQMVFEAQLTIARTAGLPVLIHARKSHDQVLAALRRVRVVGGIAHAFNGSLKQAHQYMDLGFKLGFGGMITFERSRKLRALARALPLEALVLETDAPDMTVASHRGGRNSPAFLPEVLAAIAQIRGEESAEVAERTTATAIELLGLQGAGEGGRGGDVDEVQKTGPRGVTAAHGG
jgi:TatD DNase family protein